MLRFPYLEEPLTRQVPPSLPSGATSRFRPLLPVRIFGSRGSRLFLRALLDPGSDDTVFPLDVADIVGASLISGTAHSLRWRGAQYRLRFGRVQLQLEGTAETWRWPAVVAFCDAPIRYPLLGNAGCLEFFDVTFRGDQRVLEIERNSSYTGTSA